jgi:alcohol dehydrogenase YqhD (iron-dependent ADH family)
MKDFEVYLPTRIIFGKKALKKIPKVLPSLGGRALLVYGRNSAKKTGIYQKVTSLLKEAEIEWIEFSGIKPNPGLSQVLEGVKIARENSVDFILALGGGSVIDSAKAISCGYFYPDKLWDFYEKKGYPEKALPLAVILTISGTGSEYDEISVITNEEKKLKLSLRAPVLFPKVSFLDPTLTFSVPPNYTAYGTVDAFSHVFEIYVSRENQDFDVTEDFMVILMKNIIKWGKIAFENGQNYKARANLMWASSLALTGLVKAGVGSFRFLIHALEHSLSGIFEEVPHGLGLAILIRAWMKENSKNPLLLRFYKRVFNKKSFEEGLKSFESWLKDLKIPMSLKEINIPETALSELVEKTWDILKIWKVDHFYTRDELKKIFETAYTQ